MIKAPIVVVTVASVLLIAGGAMAQSVIATGTVATSGPNTANTGGAAATGMTGAASGAGSSTTATTASGTPSNGPGTSATIGVGSTSH